MAKDPEFLILKYPYGWLPEREWTSVLGAGVKNYWSPLQNSVPKNPLAYNEARLVDTKFEDFVLQKKAINGRSITSTVKGLGKLKWAKSMENEFDLKGKVIYVKRLQQYDDFWKRITSKNNEFAETMAEWVGEKKLLGRRKYQVCLVVGLLICEDVLVATSDEQAKTFEAECGAPLGTIAETVAASQGIPISTGGIGNTKAGTTTTTVKRSYFKAKGADKKICAVELRMITTKNGKLKLDDASPTAAENRRLGEDGDEEDVDPEDLVMKDMDEKDWEELLREDVGDVTNTEVPVSDRTTADPSR